MELLAPLYLKRLGLDKADLDVEATTAKLFAVVEAHLAKIPFENLAQHGAVGGPVVLNVKSIAEKILHKGRGGFCFELNGLLAELLIEWGYTVNRVPANVYVNESVGFKNPADHMILIVTIPPSEREEESSMWFVDVGFGEPSLNPLFYEIGGMEQQTPEGMMSRFVHAGENVVLEWYKPDSTSWVPRLCWNEQRADMQQGGHEMHDFSKALEHVQEDGSIFSQKLIVCRLTRGEKITLAGNRLKRTGPPRFCADPPVVWETLESVADIRQVLRDEFGIPLKETEGLDLTESEQAPEELWTSL